MSSPVPKPDVGGAIDTLIDRLQPKLRRILSRYRLPPEDAEDVLQQSLLDFVYKRHTLYNPEAWLLATVRNRSIIYWRQRRSQICEAVDSSILELVAKPQAPSQGQIALRHDLERVLDRLPPRCRSLLKLRYAYGFKPTEVAEQLGYRPSSVRKVTSRCLARLNQHLLAIGFKENEDG
jgi:RNA polymerase sigma-70 factor (ECF subfamily)